jgi:hypothetical protein
MHISSQTTLAAGIDEKAQLVVAAALGHSPRAS